MTLYILFAGRNRHPFGGMDDCILQFEEQSDERAILKAEHVAAEGTDHQWIQLYKLHQNRLVKIIDQL